MREFLRKIRVSFQRRRAIWIGGGLVAMLLVAAAVAYWMVVPRVADDLVRERLAAVEKRAGIETAYDRVETSALEGVEIHAFRARLDEADAPVVEVEHVRASLDLYHLVFGDPVISDLEVEDAALTIRRAADGSTNLGRIRSELRDRRSRDDESGEAQNRGPGFLRYFGGIWPDLEVEDAEVRFEATEESPPWTVEHFSVGSFQLHSSGKSAGVQARIDVEAGPGGDPRWQLPQTVNFEGTLRLPVTDSTGTLTFDRPVELVGFEPASFLRGGVSRVDIAEDSTVVLRDASAAIQADGAPKPLGSVDLLRVSFADWPSGLGDLEVDEFVVEHPRLTADVDRRHGSAFHDLVQLMRAPAARDVTERAKLVARRAYLDIPRWRRPELDKSKSDGPSREDETDPGFVERLRTSIEEKFRSDVVPDRIDIRGAEVQMTDRRRMGLRNPSRELGLEKGRLSVSYDAKAKTLEAEGGFDVTGNRAAAKGAATFEVRGNYEKGTLEGRATVDALDLSWLSQILGASAARRIQGGRLDASVEIEPDGEKGRRKFSGFVAIQDAVFDIEAIAEDPVRKLDAGYEFQGYVAPNEPLPEPDHIEWRHLSWDDRERDSDDDTTQTTAGATPAPGASGSGANAGGLEGPPEDTIYPKTGALVVTDGKASLNGVAAAVRPALYGIDGLQRRPTRFDLEVELERTDVQKLFESVPEAIRGPVADAEMRGTFAWDFDAEIPLYNAGEMEWETQPKLRKFKLVSLPEAVDVRELRHNFLHVIEDDKIDYTRQIAIPDMRPVSGTYLVENTDISLGELDDRRRRRGWPPVPPASKFGPKNSPSVRSRSKVWTTEAADSMAAPTPWEEAASTSEVDSNPDPESSQSGGSGEMPQLPLEPGTLGERPETGGAAQGSGGVPKKRSGGGEPSGTTPEDSGRDVTEGYVYVPLHHISKWLPRAIMTTEDNSFFEHDGFNWFALENSVEENIEAGGFVRGASTVSMQLVKNLYLSFDKVLARKLREAYLVWLMESVVDVPKARILELYFNIIEFGPRIFGIHEASVHYFGRRPDELTLTESVFLVSIVPNPKEYHRFYEDGAITDSWFDSLITYIDIMQNRDRATTSDVQRAKSNRPTFYRPAPGDPKLRPPRAREDDASDEGPPTDDFSTIFQSSSSGEDP